MPEDIWKDRLGFGGLLLATCWDLLKELFLVVAALSLSKSKGTEYKTNQRAPTCPGTTHITVFEKKIFSTFPKHHVYFLNRTIWLKQLPNSDQTALLTSFLHTLLEPCVAHPTVHNFSAWRPGPQKQWPLHNPK
jgi:hypothetical protein